MDVLDLFGDQAETYRASLWLWNSTQGIVALGPVFETPAAGMAQIAEETGLDLAWVIETIDEGIDTYAAETYGQDVNVAVILRVETGDVVAHAAVPDGWVPTWHPRRKP